MLRSRIVLKSPQVPFSPQARTASLPMAVPADEVRRDSRVYLQPDSVSVVVVGHLQKIEPHLAKLGLGPLETRKPRACR